jgi:hypothetical protein
MQFLRWSVWAAILVGVVVPADARAELSHIHDNENRLRTVNLNSGVVSVNTTHWIYDPLGRMQQTRGSAALDVAYFGPTSRCAERLQSM